PHPQGGRALCCYACNQGTPAASVVGQMLALSWNDVYRCISIIAKPWTKVNTRLCDIFPLVAIYFVNTSAQTIKWEMRVPPPVGGTAETVRGFGQATIRVAGAGQFVVQVVVGQDAAQPTEIRV
ncbi:MAG: hypothetical protein JXA93_20815, partial [Anaerolineae bacterium]|nr:hypothetical protein [Anaerolineae bacterium]